MAAVHKPNNFEEYSSKLSFTNIRVVASNFIGFPAGIYLLKINNGNTRTMSEIYSKLTIKIPRLQQ